MFLSTMSYIIYFHLHLYLYGLSLQMGEVVAKNQFDTLS